MAMYVFSGLGNRLHLIIMMVFAWTSIESLDLSPPPSSPPPSKSSWYSGRPSRRAVFQGLVVSTAATVGASTLPACAAEARSLGVASSADAAETIRVPLQYVPSLSAYLVYFTIAGDRFGAILDTGSPFLTVPRFCSRQRWGCYRGNGQSSGLSPTTERFDNSEGVVEWKRAPFAFVNATGSMIGPTLFTFGVLSDTLTSGPGGVFFGLVRDTDRWIRPSFLGQTPVKAFQIDLASPDDDKSLTLTSSDATSLLDPNNSSMLASSYIPLTRDLNRRYGDPTNHYTAKAESVLANGSPLLSQRDRRPIYVIFDTGVSGMVVSQELFDERYKFARKNRERNLWGNVQIQLRTGNAKRGGGGEVVSLTAHKPVVTPLGQKPWPTFNAHLIVIGLAFLDGHRTTVDIDQQKLWIE
jgi:hypothetical protein